MTSGEVLERRRRRKFWLVMAAVAIPAVPLGYLVGAMVGKGDVSVAEAIASLSAAAAFTMAASFVLLMIGGSYALSKVMDEVELADNLWGSASAYGVYMILFPVWWLLGTAKVVSPVNNWAIYATALFAGTAVYFWRKWRAR